MRIPQAYFESMVKRYKKSRHYDQTDYSWIETTTKPLVERIQDFAQCKQLQDPKYTRIICETIDTIFEAAVALFQDQDQTLCLQLLGVCDSIQIWDLCLQCCDYIIKSTNQKIIDMFFSYEHILILIFHNPDYEIYKIYKLVQCMQFLIESMNTSKACKFKIEQFERIFLKFMYINAFLQKNIYNLSNQEQQELFHFSSDNNNLKITIPNDDMNNYQRYLEMSNFRKILKSPPVTLDIPFDYTKNPLEQSLQIASEIKIQKDSILFDQIFIRLLCQYSYDEQLLQKMFISNYVFHYKCTFSDLQFVNHKYMSDITNRLIDQKDFLFLLIRMIASNKDEQLEDTLVGSLQFIKSKQISLYEQNIFLEKLWLFELQGIQDTLVWWKNELQISEGNLYDNRMNLNVKLQQLFFQQLSDPQFTLIFKKQPNYTQWNFIIIQIIRKSFGQDGETKLPYYILNPILSYCISMITELPCNNQNQQLDYQLESQIIQGLVEILKNCNKKQQLQLQIRAFQLLNQLVTYYKQEFDQVQIQNAQSEFLMPVPERYHKLLAEIWSNKVLEDTLHTAESNETLYTYLITLLAITMGENPARVRQFYENNSLQYLINRIIELLKICSRASPLIVTIINLLIAISTNEQAIQLTLQTNNNGEQQQQDNLIKRIFIKCYLPSVELLHDPTVSDDFAKKIIMLYSQSMLAKRQIEKVIENTFMQISQLVDLSKDKIEEIVSNQDKLQSFYSYSKSLQALLQLFMQLQPEKKSSYRSFQGFEELQLEEAQRQKDVLFNSLLKNQKFVEALEKIIMSPILIGSKNKDTYVEHYVGILCKKNKLNPYTSLWKELDLISQNYMVIGDQKIIDIGKLVDYDALSIHMSDKYFFRKIIKHISPQTYRGFYILSRFHLIHYLIKMCVNQGVPQSQDTHLMISQLLEIYFLSSQHAGFHESIMMSMSAKQQMQKSQISYDEETQIRRRISKDNLIPLQSSCLDLINKLQSSAEQKDFIIKKYGEIIQLFFSNFQEKCQQIKQAKGIQIISLVTYLQDMLKSFKFLQNLFLNLEQQFQPLQFTVICYQNSNFFLQLIEILQHLDSVQRQQQYNGTKEQEITKKILPGFIEAIHQHIDNIIKLLIFKKIIIDKIQLSGQWIQDTQQLDLVCNELFLAQASIVNQMIDQLLYNNCEGNLKTLLEQLIQRFYSIKDIQVQEMKKLAGVEPKEQQTGNKDLNQKLSGNEVRQDQKQSLFQRPEIQAIIQDFQLMGFKQQLVIKAIQRVEIPDPHMIVEMLINDRISDDEEEQEDVFDQELKNAEQNQLIQNQLAQQQRLKIEAEQEKEQKQTEIQVLDQESFMKILLQNFPQANTSLNINERFQALINEFQVKLDLNLHKLLDQYLNNQKAGGNLLEYLFTIAKKSQHINRILEYIFMILNPLKQDKSSQDLNITLIQYQKALQWLSLLQQIASSEHEKIYQNLALIDQEPQQKHVLSFQSMITLGFALSNDIFDQFTKHGKNELQQLKTINISELNYQEICNKVSDITNNLNNLYENKQNTLKLFCKEILEAQKYLTKFFLNLQNQHDQLIERYWSQILIYLEFLIQVCTINLELQEQAQETYNFLNELDTQINNNQSLKEERDQSQNMIYLRQLIQRRFMSDKQLITQLLQCLNNFGLHNQNKLFNMLTKKQSSDKQSLFETLLQLKMYTSHLEYEESQPVFLENLIYLIAVDNKTANDLVMQVLKQVMLNEHIDWHAQQLKNAEDLSQIQFPQKYIECPLQYLLSYHPVLINNPIVYNMMIEQQGLSITDKFSELQRVHNTKQSQPQTTGKLTKEQERLLKEKEKEQQAQPQTEIVIRFEIDQLIEPQLNEHFIYLVNIIAQTTIDRFFEENYRLIEQVFKVELGQYKDDNRIYLYGWDQLLRIIEMLIIKIPQLILHLRQLQVVLPPQLIKEEKKITFIEFVIKYLTWVGGDKLANFMHNYLSDINLLSVGYGVTIGQEVLQLLLNELQLNIDQDQMLQKYYHILQLLILFTQTLTMQNCCMLLTDQRSQLNIIPQLINTLNSIKNCENSQFVRTYHQTIAKVIEPFLQSQIYYDHIKYGRYGDVFRLQQSIKDNPFQYHYLHCLKNQLISYSLYPNFKSIPGSAQHFISHQQVQQTLKDEHQQELIWPLYQSRKNYNIQKQNNQKQQEEDVSDSDSDQDIIQVDINQIKYKVNYSNINSWGSDYYYYDNNDFMSKYNMNRDDDRLQRDNQQNIFPQKDLNILFCKLDPQIINFDLPVLTVTKTNIQYNSNDYKQWITSIVGLYYSLNEYFENKKQLISKSYENQLKITVEFIHQINRLLLSSNYYRNKQNDSLQQYLQYYLNGTLNHLQVQASASCFYSKFGQPPNQLQQDYQANQLSININESQQQQQRILCQISCNILQSRVVLNGMPNDLQDQNLLKAKLQSLLHPEQHLINQPIILQVPKRQLMSADPQQILIYDNLVLEIFINLLLDPNNFPQFPFNLFRQITKCSRLGFKLLIQLLLLFQEQKNNLDLTLKILYLVSQKIPSTNLRDLLSEQLQISPILNKREKANLAKVQEIKEQFVIEEEENVDEQPLDEDPENPLVFLINQINIYCEKNISFMKLFHNPESYIPLEKNILLTPLLANQTGLHLSYLIQIIRGSLMVAIEDPKDKNKKYDDDYLSKIQRRQATIFTSFSQDETNNKLFDIVSQLDKSEEDIHLKDLIIKTFTDRYSDNQSDNWESLQYFHKQPFSLRQNELFQQQQQQQQQSQQQQQRFPMQNTSYFSMPLPPQYVNGLSQASQQQAPPIPSISILQQQQQLMQQQQQQRLQLLAATQAQNPQFKQFYEKYVKVNDYLYEQTQNQSQQIKNFYENILQQKQKQDSQQQQQQKEQNKNSQQINQTQPIQEQLLQQQQGEIVNDDINESDSKLQKKERKVSVKISHVEIDIITALCKILSNPLLRDCNSTEIINVLNTYANDKLKIEHSINELTKYIIQQSKIFNYELDRKRKQLREINSQRGKVPEQNPEIQQQLSQQENEIIKELNQKTPDPTVIQRCFIAITGFLNLNLSIQEQQKQSTNKPSSTQTRQQIQQDKKKFKMHQQGKLVDETSEVDVLTKKDIRKQFINVLQTRQTHHLWLNVVETLLLIFNCKGHRSLELLQKKLYPLLECFLRLYQNVYEDTNTSDPLQQSTLDPNFFERNTSGSATNSLQFGLLQTQNIHLKRSFSSVRNENEMQMKIDELFTYLCINGKRLINHLIFQRLYQITLDQKQNQNSNLIKLFKETDPLAFVFFKMSQIISFENKKHLFELDLEALKIIEKPNTRSRGKQNDTIEINVARETRLQQSLEKVINIDKAKFRKCDIKIRYQGERGQDEGGIRKEWMTNLVKDIQQTDKFELTTKRFYKINPNKKAQEDLNHYKLLGKIIAKGIYDGLLLPVYFISPIFKQILQKKPSFDDLEHFNEGYYDTFIKFLNDETQVQYKDLFEFWIPEEYANLIEQNKKLIFADLLQDYIEKNPIELKQEQLSEQQQQQQDSQQQASQIKKEEQQINVEQQNQQQELDEQQKQDKQQDSQQIKEKQQQQEEQQQQDQKQQQEKLQQQDQQQQQKDQQQQQEKQQQQDLQLQPDDKKQEDQQKLLDEKLLDEKQLQDLQKQQQQQQQQQEQDLEQEKELERFYSTIQFSGLKPFEEEIKNQQLLIQQQQQQLLDQYIIQEQEKLQLMAQSSYQQKWDDIDQHESNLLEINWEQFEQQQLLLHLQQQQELRLLQVQKSQKQMEEQQKEQKQKSQVLLESEDMIPLLKEDSEVRQSNEKEEFKIKKQSEDITAEDMENREKKRLIRKNKKKQLNDEVLKHIQLQDVFEKQINLVSIKHKRQICEFISKRIMLEEIKTQIQALREGFFDILPKEFFSYMDWRDLQKLIIGVPSVDVDDLQANTEYINYEKNNQTVVWFWEVLTTLSDSEKADFLMFATGSPLVPFGGFKNLRGPNGPRKFSISKDFNKEHFIKAHACFNRIDLPEYSSKEIVREKLLKSLKESGSGFDLS